MPSSPRVESPYSLTRRLAARFAVTTSALIALYAIWAGYFAYDAMRDDLEAFMVHETAELAKGVEQCGDDVEAIREKTRSISEVTDEPPCAFRVRDGEGRVLAQAGIPALLDLDIESIDPHTSWRRDLAAHRIGLRAVRVTDTDMQVEIIADLNPLLGDLLQYFVWALLAFLLSVLLAGFSGWFSAVSGLRSLRQVVRQARSIDPVAQRGSIHLEGAPQEIREVSDALNAMLERIEDGMANMRTFTAGLAHELRSPLQNLIGETEVALLSERTGEEYEQLLRSNLEDLDDLSDAVDNLVTYCRTSEPPARGAHCERFDLATEADLRMKRESRSAGRGGIELALTTSGETTLFADREACLRVLRNLVRNAIAWSPAGSTVRVQITGDGDRVAIIVDDEGPGVPPALGDRIFDPFVSGRTSADRRGGYGLGLAICRSVMSDHGGRVTYEARAGGGSRFIAAFPRQVMAAA